MKKSFVTVLAIALILSIAAVANASEVILETTVTSAETRLDKNGNEYVRMIVPEQRELKGVKYEIGVAVMAFGDQVQPAKAFKADQAIKALCSVREYKGRTSYTVVKFLQ